MLLRALRKWTSLGKFPQEADDFANQSNVIIAADQLPGSITYRNFRAPGRWSNWKRRWFLGSIAVLQDRLIAYQWSNRLINIPFTDQRIHSIQLVDESLDKLAIIFDAKLFHADWSGTIECRFSDVDAPAMKEAILAQTQAS